MTLYHIQLRAEGLGKKTYFQKGLFDFVKVKIRFSRLMFLIVIKFIKWSIVNHH